MRRFPALLVIVTALVLSCLLIVGCSSSASVSDSTDLGTEGIVESTAAETEQEAEKSEEADDKATAEEDNTAEDKATPSGEGFTVCIDAGHQAQGDSSQEPIGPGASETKARVTSGTSGVASGLSEYEVNLAVALKLRDYLESKGVTVVMVRETHDVNISNSERAAVANDAGADLFVRLHCDGSETSSKTNGIGLYIRATGEKAAECEQLANALMSAMTAATGANAFGIYKFDTYTGLNWSTVPCVMVEMGFMSNPEEDVKLTDPAYQAKLVEGMVNGICAFVGR